jgi:hypothetical protein
MSNTATKGFQPGTLVLGTHDSVVGPGGQHVYKDFDAWVIDYRTYI